MNLLEPLPRTPISLETLLQRAEMLAPALRDRAEQTERNRMIPPETMVELHAAGLLSYFVPQRYGGAELPWGSQARIGRILAGACASTSWIACVVGSHSAYVARMAPEAQDDVWGEGGNVLIATGSVARNVTIEAKDGGYAVKGRWSFCSGIDHASWALFRGTPAGDTRQHYLLIPRDSFAIEDDWYVSGMSGTGSKSAVVDAWVPAYRTLDLNTLMDPNPPGARVNAGSVYSYNFRPFAGSALLGPIIGGAEGALADYRLLLESGTGGLDFTDPQTQLAYAESAAEVGAAVQLLEAIVARQQAYAAARANVPHADRVALVRDRTFTARLCFNAVERLMHTLPLDQVLLDPPIQRHFRDLAAMVQQIGVNWDRNMISCVRASFGLGSDIPYLNSDKGTSQ